jgi:aquaporin Z
MRETSAVADISEGSASMGKTQKYLAEALGTFTLVGIGSFAIVSAGGAGEPAAVLSIAFGFGLALLVGLYAFGEVSGGHFNPAVSLGMFLDRRLAMDDLIGYWIAQFAGAIAASLVVLIAYDDSTVAATTTQASDTWAAIVVEFVMTALFVAVILQSTKSERVRGTALVAIPLTLLAIHVAIIPISGSSVNPARSFGPALVGTEFHDYWIYLIFPMLGAILGWILHKVIVEGDTNLRDDLDVARSAMRRSDAERGPGEPPAAPPETD